MKPSILWVLFVTAAITANACQRLEADRIRAADLAAVVPVFASLDPATEVGLSPLPGVTRVFHPADLLRLARSYGVPLPAAPAEVCFERPGSSERKAAAPSAPAPLAVRRGEQVAVKAVCGEVVLRFEAEAESSGRPGDTVMLLNPENGNRFAARIEARGKVVVNR
jgi:hypothetical protein